jgi:methylmalonyl-CoA mutase
MMKYHIQTSGRSLHARRSSSMTSAPRCRRSTPRRALAIQMIINKELGLNFNENPWQGSFAVEYITDR